MALGRVSERISKVRHASLQIFLSPLGPLDSLAFQVYHYYLKKKPTRKGNMTAPTQTYTRIEPDVFTYDFTPGVWKQHLGYGDHQKNLFFSVMMTYHMTVSSTPNGLLGK